MQTTAPIRRMNLKVAAGERLRKPMKNNWVTSDDKIFFSQLAAGPAGRGAVLAAEPVAPGQCCAVDAARFGKETRTPVPV